MAYVTEAEGESTPTVLIVDNNPMSITRLSNIFKVKEFKIKVCEDGDKAVDEYIRLDPELVVLSLDIPSLDGHLAALEIREHGGEGRIIFVAPKRQAQLAADAAYSAGAVAWLQKPVITADLDKIWEVGDTIWVRFGKGPDPFRNGPDKILLRFGKIPTA